MADHAHSAIVGARGHLIDSKILNTIFDIVIERGGAFEVMDFQIGRTNDDFSRLTLKVSTPTEPSLQRLVEDLMPFGCAPIEEHDALVRTADRDGCVPDDFYSTTNMRTEIRVDNFWKMMGFVTVYAALYLAACRDTPDCPDQP